MHAALQEHDDASSGGCAPKSLEQAVVEGIAGSHLDDVHAGIHHNGNLAFFHHLGGDGKTSFFLGLDQDLESRIVALIGVGAGTGLPDAAAKTNGTSFLDCMSRFQVELGILGIDGTMPSNHVKAVVEHHPAQRHFVVREVGLAVHQLVGDLDAIHPFDKVEAFQARDEVFVTFIARNGINGAGASLDGSDTAPVLGSDLFQLLHLRRQEPCFSRQNHKA